MLKVVKRDGRLQDFEVKKIILSVERASDDINQSMNESDGENIAELVKRHLNNLKVESINGQQLKDIVIDVLKELGFSSIAEEYFQGKRR